MKRNHLIALSLVALLAALVMLFRSGKVGGGSPGASARPAGAPRPAGVTLKAQREIPAIPLEVDVDPRGALSLRGLILDGEGLPVEGAVVTINTTPSRSVDTDVDGSFLIADLVPRAYEIEAHKEDDVAGPVSVQLSAETAPVNLWMRRAGSLEVTVVSATQKSPIAAATVELRGTSLRESVSDAEGKVLLHGVFTGKYIISVSAKGYAPTFKTYQAVELPRGGDQIKVELRAGVAVSGRVVDQSGDPVAGARVLAEEATAIVPLTDAQRDSVLTDSHGDWSVPSLLPGTYRFSARSEGHAPGVSSPISIDGVKAREGIVISLPLGALLAGRVATSDGESVAFATVRVVVDEGTWGQVVARQTSCTERGEFTFKGLPRRRVNAVALSGTSTSLTRTIDLAQNPEQTGVVLALDADGKISGSVQNASGQPVADALILAEPAAPAAKSRTEVTLRGALSAVADGQGRFSLQGLPTGKYLLRASWPGTSLKRRTSWLRSAVMAHTGSKDAVLKLTADSVVRGRVQKEDGSPPGRFTVTIGGSATFGGAAGEFSISDVPAGTHMLTITGADFASKLLEGVEVKPDEDKDLGVIVLQGGRRITGRVLRADGTPVAGATVTASKQISGVVAGPSGAMVADVKQVTSQDDGAYSLEGLGLIALAVGAEDAREGKSDFLMVPAGSQSQTLDLVLKAVGALQGTVKRNGEPVGGAVVVVSAKGAPSGGSGVTTGTDGSYQFDALTPGTYTLIAMFDNGSGPQMKQASVTVKSRETVRHNIELPKGEVTLVVGAATSTPGDGSVDSVRVFLTEVQKGKDAQGGSNGRSQVLTRSAPARFSELAPGSYQICLVALGGKAEPDAGKPTPPPCTYVGVTDGPAEQQVSVKLPGG